MKHVHSAYPCTTCAVERAKDCRSIWEHPTVQTYDPWGLGSDQSEHMTQIARVGGGGCIGHGLVGTWLSGVNVCYLKTFHEKNLGF